MAENGNSKEKKNARTRRAPTGEKNSRQQDQVLTGAENPPRVGKIAAPKRRPSRAAGKEAGGFQKGRGKAARRQKERRKGGRDRRQEKGGNQPEVLRQKRTQGPKARHQPDGGPGGGPSRPAGGSEKRTARKGRSARGKKSQKPPIKVYFLGGLNEIGKNFTLYECQGDMVIVDCGLSFRTTTCPVWTA